MKKLSLSKLNLEKSSLSIDEKRLVFGGFENINDCCLEGTSGIYCVPVRCDLLP